MRALTQTLGVICYVFAILTFFYGLVSLLVAEINMARSVFSSSTVMNPTFALAWLLVSLILGLAAKTIYPE